MSPDQGKAILSDKACKTEAAQADKEFPADFALALKVHSEEVDANISRPSDVFQSKQYAYQIFQDFALLTEAEFKKVTGSPPTKKDAFESQFHGPTSKTPMFTCSLEGMAPDEIASVRKVRVSYQNGLEMNSNLLQSENQLLESQGRRIFQFLTDNQLKKRPSTWQGSSKPPSIGDLWQRKAEEEQSLLSERERVISSLNGVQPDEEDEDSWASDDAETKNVQPEMPGRKAGVALDSDDEGRPKAKAKASIRKSKRAAMTTEAAQTDDDQEKVEKASSAGGKSQSRQSSQTGVANLDKEMQLVADKHLLTGGGSSIKSLEFLKVRVFLCIDEAYDTTTLSGFLRGALCLNFSNFSKYIFSDCLGTLVCCW